MESSLPMLLFFGFVFGSMLLMLYYACPSRVDASTLAAESPTDVPHGATLGDAALRSLLAGLEEHLRRERALAVAFVSEPTVETLFPPTDPNVGARMRALEGRLRDEQFAIERFAADPTIDGHFSRPATACRDATTAGPGARPRWHAGALEQAS